MAAGYPKLDRVWFSRLVRTGMALLRNDGVVLVAVRKDMMRVIGDKLLSFLH